jgi:hypothetical protein
VTVPERPRKTQKDPERPRKTQKDPERPRKTQKDPERPRKTPERPRQAVDFFGRHVKGGVFHAKRIKDVLMHERAEGLSRYARDQGPQHVAAHVIHLAFARLRQHSSTRIIAATAVMSFVMEAMRKIASRCMVAGLSNAGRPSL